MKFYRVANIETQQGLWYDFKGNFTGNIHDKFSFCKSANIPMPFDEDTVGWLSATASIETLHNWFSEEDILELQKHGYIVAIYESDDYKALTTHFLIKQDTAKLIGKIIYE